jgi:excisionase family DNA binding protein
VTDKQTRLTMSVPEVAAALGLKTNFTYAAVQRGEIPSVKIGKLVRIPIALLNEMLEAGRTKDVGK